MFFFEIEIRNAEDSGTTVNVEIFDNFRIFLDSQGFGLKNKFINEE